MQFLATRRGRILAATLITVLVVAAIGAWAATTLIPSYGRCPADGGSAPASPTAVATARQPGVPRLSHVFTIVLENEEATSVLGNPSLPYIQQLAAQGAVLDQFYAICHPSLPNYLAMISGATHGVHSNCTGCLRDAPTIVDGLDASGRSWKAYLEGLPGRCFLGTSAGRYEMKHNPFAYFHAIRNDPGRCNRIAPFGEFAGDLASGQAPDYAFIVPDMCHGGHDCSLSTADRWLSELVPAILASPAWRENGLLVVTFDEGDTKEGCCGTAAGGRVATILLSPLVKAGAVSSLPYTHYSLLSTIAAGLGVAAPGNAAHAAAIGDIWVASGP